MRYCNEWEQHRGTLLCFPSHPHVWRYNYERLVQQYINLIYLISSYEDVYLLCQKEFVNHTRKILPHHNVFFIPCDHNRIWVRDYAPLWIKSNQQIQGLIFDYLDYRNQFPHFHDAGLGKLICDYFQIPSVESHECFEGGNFIHNHSIAISVRSCECFQAPYHMSSFGNLKVCWIEKSIPGDKTQHADNVAMFIDNDVLLTYEGFFSSEISYSVKKNIVIPHPNPIGLNDKILPYSYLNGIILNNALVFPKITPIYDTMLLERIRPYYQGDIHFFDCCEVLRGGGGMHCITKEILN